MSISTLDQIDLLSVGIDVGSSTSHLIFSNLTLMKNIKTATKRYEVVNRKIIYEGKIIDTPLVDKNNIDMAKL
ncbi:MAG: ethanolamine ammonia-lyase reactivating factor EutA, partial [Candidatus Kariarchaeaceae archaeon]